LNADGKTDLVVANLGSSDGGGASVSILFQDPAAPGAFLAAQSFNTGRSSPFLTAGDLNRDDLPDVAIIDGAGQIDVLLQSAAQPGVFQQPVTYSTQLNPLAVAIGDFNADGFMDLVNLDGGGIEIRLQSANAPGSFESPFVLAPQ
jgi:hypothetical protein